jgi:hypothetical protein
MQADQHLHASYVDRIVATLGATVKTGTGVARKTPVQLNDGSWVSAISPLMEWAWSINVCEHLWTVVCVHRHQATHPHQRR